MLYDIFCQTLNQDEYIQYLLYCTQNVLELNSYLSLFSIYWGYHLPHLHPQCYEVVMGNSRHMNVL